MLSGSTDDVMKTRIALLTLGTALSTLMSIYQAHADTPRIGVAAAVRNEVTATPISAQPHALTAGGGIFENDTIRTGTNSVVQLLFQDQTTLSVGPRSEVRLDHYVYDPHQSSGDVAISLVTGALRFITGSQDPHNYSIHTPVATIGVRGTIVDFLFINGRAFAILDEGRALFTLGNGHEVASQDTVPFCLWSASVDPSDFPSAFWRSIRAGGDQDTICAITCGIVAARTPAPPEWVELREPFPVDITN